MDPHGIAITLVSQKATDKTGGYLGCMVDISTLVRFID